MKLLYMMIAMTIVTSIGEIVTPSCKQISQESVTIQNQEVGAIQDQEVFVNKARHIRNRCMINSTRTASYFTKGFKITIIGLVTIGFCFSFILPLLAIACI